MSRVHKRYRRQTTDGQSDGLAIAYSEREREFTFAKNGSPCYRNVTVVLCCPVYNVGVLWPNGWIDQDETCRHMQVSLGRSALALC